MPVTGLTLAAFALLLLGAPGVVQARARVIIRHASQLQDEAGVVRASQPYLALVRAHVLYEECGEALGISAAKRQYLLAQFVPAANAYQAAYQEAFEAHVGVPPTQEMVDDIAAFITRQQQMAVDRMAGILRDKGCFQGKALKLQRYVDALYQRDTAPIPTP
ncbi:MAG: hypothetical protein SFW64_08690 [Alphaproteobacteria bacterium]|nr:hypothetical protein [Alphaproteobacteria bacterium]